MGQVLEAFADALGDQRRRGLPRLSVEQVRKLQHVTQRSAEIAKTSGVSPLLSEQHAMATSSPAASSSAGLDSPRRAIETESASRPYAPVAAGEVAAKSLVDAAKASVRSPKEQRTAAVVERPKTVLGDMPWLVDEEAAALEHAERAVRAMHDQQDKAVSRAPVAVEQMQGHSWASHENEPVPVWHDEDRVSSSPAATDPRRRTHVHAEKSVAERQSVPTREVASSASAKDSPGLLRAIRENLGDCQRCALAATRKHIVFGEGDPKARLMLIGEAPSRMDDERGRLFSDEAGELLNNMLKAMGLSREQVYTTSILKCRPPQNRAGEREELAACAAFLRPQIEAVRPEVILTLGSEASRLLLGHTFEFAARRGEWGAWENIPVMPTWHPGYLVHYPAEKRSAWADLQRVMERLGLRG